MTYVKQPLQDLAYSKCSINSSLCTIFTCLKKTYVVFPGGSVVTNLPTTTGDTGSILGLGRSPGRGNDNQLLGNLIDSEAWWATVHGVAKSWTRLSD